MPRNAWKPGLRKWQICPPADGLEGLSRKLGVSSLICQLLVNRGIETAEAGQMFFGPKLTDLHDPGMLSGAEQAARRIARAIKQGEKIVIYGDYDVDGMTSVAILEACFKLLGASADYYVPHRLEEGYGVNPEAIAKIAREGCDLLITVDCGISAVEPLAEATAAGMDVIVTDHHGLGERLPEVEAIVHPALPGTLYPNPHLCGAGVALKLAWQVARQVAETDRVDAPMRKFLLDATTLAALGTIADVVPLIGENRSLAHFGLAAMGATDHTGIAALRDAAGIEGKLDSFDVGFKLAPRLNACGRMGHARLAVELLTGPEPAKARKIAEYLTEQNSQRQKVGREVLAEALEMVEAKNLAAEEAGAIVLAGQDWHGGVVGIVASRLVDRFAKPTILISRNGESLARGSGRSIPGLHMRDALAACADLLVGFGGHAMAAGLTIETGKLDAFAARFGQYASENLRAEDLAGSLDCEAEVSLADLAYPTVERIDRMAPFGQGNPRPVLAVRGVRVVNPPKRMGRTGKTAGMVVGQGPVTMRAVGFGMGDLAELLVGVNDVDIAVEPVLNHFRGRTSVELQLKDVVWQGMAR